MTLTFQEIINRLNAFWAACGCIIAQPYDVEVGAGTMTPGKCLGSPTTHPPSPSLRRTGMAADEKFLNRRERRKQIQPLQGCNGLFEMSTQGSRCSATTGL